MITFQEIDGLKPVAAPKGYLVSTCFLNGSRKVGLHRDVDSNEPLDFYATTVEKALEFLAARPALPRFRVRVTYTNGAVEAFEYHEVDHAAAMVRGAKDGHFMGCMREDPPLVLKSLEIEEVK